MKSNLIVLSIFLMLCLSLASCGQNLKKLNNSDEDAIKIEIAQSFATSFLSTLKEGLTYQFNDEATESLKNNLTEENQRTVYNQLKDQFGDFKTLSYAETWIQADNNSMHIVRLKGDFKKSKKKVEIRVVVNDSNQIAGFWIKPWSDML